MFNLPPLFAQSSIQIISVGGLFQPQPGVRSPALLTRSPVVAPRPLYSPPTFARSPPTASRVLNFEFKKEPAPVTVSSDFLNSLLSGKSWNFERKRELQNQTRLLFNNFDKKFTINLNFRNDKLTGGIMHS